MDEQIETLLNRLDVDFAKLRYYGSANTYIVYQLTDNAWKFSSDDFTEYYVAYYDFDVYSKTNYDSLLQELISLMESADWDWEINRSSGDLFEEDTKLYHRTLCFSKIIWRSNNG